VTLLFGIKTVYPTRYIFICSAEGNVVFMTVAGFLPREDLVFIEQTSYLYILIILNILLINVVCNVY